MTQKNIILNFLRDKGIWVPSFDLQKVTTIYGWLGTSADRQARQMAEDGLISREQRGKYAYYRSNEVKEFGKQDQGWRVLKKQRERESLEKQGQGVLVK